jgi:hypothetical protein
MGWRRERERESWVNPSMISTFLQSPKSPTRGINCNEGDNASKKRGSGTKS